MRIFGTRTRRQLQAINEAYTATCAATLPIYHPTRHTPRHVRPLGIERILLQPPHTRTTASSAAGVSSSSYHPTRYGHSLQKAVQKEFSGHLKWALYLLVQVHLRTLIAACFTPYSHHSQRELHT